MLRYLGEPIYYVQKIVNFSNTIYNGIFVERVVSV